MFSYDVVYLNRAPVITVPTYNFPSINEDTASQDGSQVGAVAMQIARDDDDSTIGLAVTQVDSSSGQWQYRTAGNEWTPFPDVTSDLAFHLLPNVWIRFNPDLNFVGSSSLVVVAWDVSNGNSITLAPIPSYSSSGPYSQNSSQLLVGIRHINDPPVITLAQSEVNYTENGDPVPIFGSSLAITDVDNTSLHSAIITFSCSNCPMEGQSGAPALLGSGLSLASSSSDMIRAKYTPNVFQVNPSYQDNGFVLVITSSVSNSLESFQAYLRSLCFTTVVDEPAIADRSVSLSVSDGLDTSNIVEVTIRVIPVNDNPPDISLPYTAINYTEESGSLILFPTSNIIFDPDETLPLYRLTATLMNADMTESLTSSYSGTLDIESTGHVLTFSNGASIEEYNAALRSLAYNNSAEEPGPTSTVVRLVVYDGMFLSPSRDLTIQVQPINDNLPEIAIPTREVSFVEQNPMSPSVRVAVGATITDRDVPRTPIASLVVEILNPLNSNEERVHIMGSLSSDVTFNSSNPHRLVIQAANVPLQLQILQDALGIVYYENIAEEPIGPNRTILISAIDDLYQSGVQQSSPEIVTLVFQPTDDPPRVMILNTLVAYTEDQEMRKVSLAPNATIVDVDNDNLAALEVQLTASFPDTSDEVLSINPSLLSGNPIALNQQGPSWLNLTGVAPISTYQALLRSLEYENTDTSGNPVAGQREVIVIAYSAGGAGGGIPDIVTINFGTINDPPILDLNGDEPGRDYLVTFTEESSSAVSLLPLNFRIEDPDSIGLSYVNITLAPFLDEGEERLVINSSLAASISLEWVSPVQFTLRGQPSPVSEFRTLLSSLMYINSADEPSSQSRVVTFIASDGDMVSDPAMTTITINLVNDAPVLSINDSASYSSEFTENGLPVSLSPNPSIVDDDSTTFTMLRVEMVNPKSGDIITANVPLDFSSDAYTVNLNSANKSSVETILSSLRFSNNLPEPPAGNRQFCISVSDGIDWSNRACVTVGFIPVNDNPPVFSQESYSGSVTEGQVNETINLSGLTLLNDAVTDNDTINSPVERVWSIIAGDDCHSMADGGETGDHRFFSGDSSTPEMTLSETSCRFMIDRATGSILTTSTPPDREQTSFYNLTVSVFDGVFDAMTIVQVTIVDIKDTPPCFIPNTYNATIPQGAQSGYILANLTVVDPDLNEDISIQSPALLSVGISGAFAIDNENQLILTIPETSLPGEISEYVLELRAIDSNFMDTDLREGCAGRAYIQAPFNRHAPAFNEPSYSTTLLESSTVNSSVLSVEATDPDEGRNGEIRYSIPQSGLPFAVNTMTGEITLISSLDFEATSQYYFSVVAEDQAKQPTRMRDEVNVSIMVQNVNEYPPFLAPVTVTVCENIPVGTLIQQLNASDQDAGVFGQVRYSSTFLAGCPNCFSVSENGAVTVAAEVDYENSPITELTITVTDGGNRFGFSSVTINILNDNEAAPQFEEPDYMMVLPETYPINTVFLTVSATDSDTCGIDQCNGTMMIDNTTCSDNSIVQYSIVDGNEKGLFEISPSNGSISLVSMLDFDVAEDRDFDLTVIASDGQLESQTQVRIMVFNVSEDSPVFENTSYQVTIPEDLSVGTTVLTVLATDADQTPFTYSISGPGASDFTIGRTSGVIVVFRQLDYETRQLYNLVLMASESNTMLGMAMLSITLTDINDNAPVFDQQQYNFFIAENEPASMLVGTVRATDEDSTSNGNITYSISSITPHNSEVELFVIDRITGAVSSNAVFDRESQASYSVVVLATDGGNPAESTSVTVTVMINDTNDNAPMFSQSTYNTSAREDMPSGTVILQPSVIDEDIGENSLLVFSITAGNEEGKFSINSSSGDIIIASTLDYESSQQYQLNVSVSDSGTPQLEASTTVNIAVVDVNDNPPVFTSALMASIVENSPNGSHVLTLSASDADTGSNAAVNFHITNIDNSPFMLDSATGVITVSNSLILDREQQAVYHLDTIAFNPYNPSGQNTTAVVTITVSDENDNAPMFSQAIFTVEIAESFTPVNETGPSMGSGGQLVGSGDMATLVLQVTASDADDVSTPNAQIKYYIIGGSGQHNFTIDMHSGAIQTMVELDRESENFYTLTIRATDCGETPLSSTANVEITVLDINDNQPVFSQNMYSADIEENSPAGTELIFVAATDDDTTSNAQLTYSLVTVGSPFTIDSSTGLVTLSGSVDRETTASYQLDVRVSDGGVPSLSSNVILSVTVLDRNDNPPVIQQLFLNSPIPENSPPGTLVARFAVSDPDIGTNAVVTLQLDGDAANLAVSNNGEVTVNGPLDFEQQTSYAIVLVAVNSAATPGLRSTFNFSIGLINLNDNAPIVNFSNPSITFTEGTSRIPLAIGARIIDTDGRNFTSIYDAIVEFIHPSPLEPSHPFLPTTNSRPYDCSLENKQRKLQACQFSNRQNLLPPDSDISYTPFGGLAEPTGQDDMLVFDAANGQFAYAISANSFPSLNGNALTIMLWVWYTPNTGPSTIYAQVSDSGYVAYGAICDSGSLMLLYFANGTQQSVAVDGACSLIANSWHHLAVVNKPISSSMSQLIVYIDGEAFSTTEILQPVDNNGRLYLGGRPVNGLFPPATDFFTGRMHLLVLSPTTASDIDINCVIGCGAYLYSSLSEPPVSYSYNYTSRRLFADGVMSVDVYETFLNSLIMVVAFDEPRQSSYDLDYTVSDGTFNCIPITLNITIIPSNDGAPVLRLNGDSGVNYVATYVEEAGPASIVNETGLTLTDVDLLAFTYEIVAEITDPMQPAGQEVLEVSNVPDGMSQSFTNHTLRVRGRFILSEFESVLRTLTYNNLADEPNGTSRTVTVLVLDEDFGPRMSNMAQSSITFRFVNDPPELDIVSANLEYSEGDGTVQILTSAAITDSDNTTLVSARIAFDAPDGDNETLSVTIPVGVGITSTTTTDSTENILSLTGEESIANYAAVLMSLSYQNSRQGNPTAGTRVISFTLFDGISFSAPVQTNLFIGGVNDFPVVDLNGPAPGSDFQTSFEEDVDDLVAAVSQNLTITDVDSTELAFINITFSSRPDGSNEKVVVETTGTSFSFNETGNSFILAPVDFSMLPISDFVDVLRTLQYQNEAEEPSTGIRVLQIMASDGIDISPAVYSRITIFLNNDEPSLDLDSTSSGTGYSTIFIENGSPVEITSANVLITDNDASSVVTRVRVTIDNPLDGNSEVIRSTDSSISLPSPTQPEYIIIPNDTSTSFVEHLITTLTYANLEEEPTPGVRMIHISVSDGMAYSNVAVCQMEIQLINDHTPVFAPSSSLSVFENAPSNTTVTTVSAVDQDSGAPGIVQYSIIQSNPASGISRFQINPTSGLLVTTTSLDREEYPSYSLTILAKDMGSPSRNATTILIVSVLDMNDNIPQFAPSTQFSLSVSEQAMTGEVIETIRAVDPDLPSNSVTFSSVGGNGSSLFNVLVEGDITVAAPLDADAPVNPVYSLTVEVTDLGGQSSTGVFIITVLDVNDNTPQFNSSLYEADVNENRQSEFVVRVFAVDYDSSSNAQITYSISNSDFIIDNVTGDIHTARPLDREEQEVIEFTVTARDGGTPQRSNTSLVRVRLLDENDNKPVFNQTSYTGSVLENTPSGFPVLTVMASDADAGSNAAIRYRLGNSLLSLFGVNSLTGQVYVEEPLDYELLMPVHTITVVATDMGSPAMSASTSITITIIDANDNAPEFTNSTYTGSVTENAAGFSIVNVSATDMDSGSNSEIRYQLLNYTKRFVVDNTSGVVSTLVDLDFEEICSYQLTVRAYDLGNPSLSGFAIVNVNVLPLNDRPPSFNRTEYKAQVIENGSPGMFVVEVLAVEDDQTVCEEDVGSAVGSGEVELLPAPVNLVSYSLLNYTDLFEINSTSGVIMTRTSLDREQVAMYAISVRAIDPSGLTSLASVVVMVGDVNDNEPKFQQDRYTRHIPENSSPGTSVLQVMADDPDSLDAGRLMYSLDGVALPNYLAIQPQSGLIFVSSEIDFETVTSPVNFLVIVRDSSGMFDAADVTIFVVDTNDRPPSIDTEPQTVSFTEGQVSVNPFNSISISDPDTFQNLTNATIMLLTPDAMNITANTCFCEDTTDASTCSNGCFEFLQLSPSSFPGSITQSDNARVLTLEGSYPITVYESAIDDVRYINLISNPSPESRMVSLFVTDGQMPSNVLTQTIEMTLLNQFAPVIDLNGPDAGNDYQTQFTERGSPVLLTSPDLVISDQDTAVAVQQLTAVRVWVSNPLDDGESIGFPSGFSLPSGITLQRVSLHNISLVGQAPIEAYVSVIRQLQYSNPASEPNPSSKLVTFRAQEFHLTGPISTTTITLVTFNDFAPRIVADPPADNYVTDYREGSPGVPLVTAEMMIEDEDGREDPVVQLQVYILSPGQFDRIFLIDTNISSSLTMTQLSSTMLRVSGSASRSSYEEVVRRLRYQHTSDELSENEFMRRKFVAMEIYDASISSISFTQITLTPVNDQQPIFDQPLYTAGVPENASVGYTVIQLQANDGDRFTVSQMQFSITAGNQDGLFAISVNGTITLIGMLNFEESQFYNLSVRVVDLNYVGSDSGGMAVVEIAVGDSNDHVPQFNQSSYNGTVSEGVPLGTAVVTVFAEDIDSSIHSQLVFAVDGTSQFTVDAAGVVRTSMPIDREESEFHSFNVTVRNPGFLAHDTAQVFVTVIDTDDNDPVISLVPSEATLTEPQTRITLATNIAITDTDPDPSLDSARVEIADEGAPGTLLVPVGIDLLVSGNGTSRLEFSGLRALSEYEAALSSIMYQDLSDEPELMQRRVLYQVFSGEANSTIATFTISVSPINDNAPVIFLDTRNTSSVSPSAPEFTGVTINPAPGSFVTIFEEGGPAVPLTDASLTITDSDVGDSIIQSAFIELANPGDGAEERLSVVLSSGISGTVSSHRLSLNGSGSHADYTAVLRTVR